MFTVSFLFFNDIFEYFCVFFLPSGLGNSDTTLCMSHCLVLDATNERCYNTCLGNGGSPLGALKQTLHPETLMEEINPLGTSLAV